MDMEDTEKLINAVHSYSPLWNMKDKRYHLRDVQRKLWIKVSEEMGSDVANLKKKWKGLRDTFRKEHKKLLKSGPEAPDNFISTWPFFDQMLFLSNVMLPRERTTSSNPNRKIAVYDEIKGAVKKKMTFKNSRKSYNSDAEFLEIERQKLKWLSETTSMKEDSDYQFLLSLLPYLKKVTEPRKLIVRHRLQQVLINEENYSAFQHQEPSTSHASRYESAQPSPGDSSWTSGPKFLLSCDAATQSSWTLQDQPDG